MDSLLQFPHQARIHFFRRQTFHCWKPFRSLQDQAHTRLQPQPLLWFTLHASTSTHGSLPHSSQAEQPAVELVWSKVCWLRAFACASPAPSASLAPGFLPGLLLWEAFSLLLRELAPLSLLCLSTLPPTQSLPQSIIHTGTYSPFLTLPLDYSLLGND